MAPRSNGTVVSGDSLFSHQATNTNCATPIGTISALQTVALPTAVQWPHGIPVLPDAAVCAARSRSSSGTSEWSVASSVASRWTAAAAGERNGTAIAGTAAAGGTRTTKGPGLVLPAVVLEADEPEPTGALGTRRGSVAMVVAGGHGGRVAAGPPARRASYTCSLERLVSASRDGLQSSFKPLSQSAQESERGSSQTVVASASSSLDETTQPRLATALAGSAGPTFALHRKSNWVGGLPRTSAALCDAGRVGAGVRNFSDELLTSASASVRSSLGTQSSGKGTGAIGFGCGNAGEGPASLANELQRALAKRAARAAAAESVSVGARDGGA
ncbi:hypothetical protein DFJ73DRAFT_876014 [Zopfochytrium polystomum]|nr:hypothetical protein DFJ73DRAFT_876014 [Zopfochytrium polystomum]